MNEQIGAALEVVEQGFVEGLKGIGVKTLSPAAQSHLEAAMASLRAVMVECLTPDPQPVTGAAENEPTESKAAMARRVFKAVITPFSN